MKKVFILLIVLWMGIIFFFSCEDGIKSKERSVNVASTSVTKIRGIINKSENSRSKDNSTYQNNINRTSSNIINRIEAHLFLIRKIAHVLEYFILGVLVNGIILIYKKKMSWNIIISSILLCVLYACFDEIHQLFVPGRTGRVFDVFVDFIGISMGCLFYSFIWLLYNKKKRFI